MINRSMRLALVLVVGAASTAVAQTAPPENVWSRGTTFGLFAGVGTASSRSGVLVGGALGWEITPRFGLEGTFGWLDRSGRGEAFAADLTAQVAITKPGVVAPYVKGGFGLYRASFDSPFSELPDFYRRRLGPNSPALRVNHTFTDPSFVVGGGARVFATRQWSIEPEVAATIVRRASRSHVVTAVSVSVAYHFEEHPITPATRYVRSVR